jgi:CubicO group peptidase (beta-lactamase class C family)
MAKGSRAGESKREPVLRFRPLTSFQSRVKWIGVASAGIALMIALTAQSFAASAPQKSAPQPEVIGTVRQVYDGTLYPDIQVRTFRNIDRLFPTRTVKRGTSVYPLPQAEAPLKEIEFTSAGKKYDLYDYMSLSVVKSITSTLVGAAIQDGHIKSIDDPVTKYLPKLSGSAYEGVTIRNLLQMASGVRWDETYTNPASDRRRMLELQLSGKPGSILQFMSTLSRAGEPGTIWNYNTGETHVVGELIHAAVNKPVAQYLSERIWSKLGMESDATWWLESPDGQEIGGSGLSATLRDYGRFGLFVMNQGLVGEERILPEGWFREAGTSKTIGGKKVNYGYMWWIPDASSNPLHESAFLASGIFGQSIYMNPAAHIVVVVWSARPKPTGTDVIDDEDFFAAVVRTLH